MKTDLDHLPIRKQRELKRFVDLLHHEFETARHSATSDWKKRAQIRAVILYGSYARGGWVDEYYTGRGYQSDYDIMIIVNDQKTKEMIEDFDLLNASPLWRVTRPPVNAIVHTLQEVNGALARGRYFFVDIYREGIALYAAKNMKLRSPSPLPPDIALDMAQEYAEFWTNGASTSLEMADFAISKGKLNEAAFNLHQAAERTYGALLLTLTNHMPQTHNLKLLRSISEGIEPTLIDIWPRATRTDRKPFNKLLDAYVKARYSRHYRIDLQTLEILIKHITHLHDLVGAACDERLKTLRAQL